MVQFVKTLTNPRGADVHVAGDGNFHHQPAAGAGHETLNKVQDPKYFTLKEDIDAHGLHIETSWRRPAWQYWWKVPDSVVNDCKEGLTAVNKKNQKTNSIKFDDTGLAALVCHHDIPYFFANIDTPGEQQKYMVGLLAYLFTLLPPQMAILCLYDVGCILEWSLQLVSLLHISLKITNECLTTFLVWHFTPWHRNTAAVCHFCNACIQASMELPTCL